MSKRNSTALVPAAGSGAVMALPAVGNLDAYISAVHRLPMLTAEREIDLARRFRDAQDLDAARELVMSHLRLVVSVARQYLGYGLPHGDLIQEGNIGLMKAVKRFDPERGVRLVSFALHWIKAEIHEYILKNWRMVKVATTKAQRKLFFNLRSHKKGAHTLTPAEVDAIARELNVREKDVIEMETRLGGQDLALDGQVDDGEESYAPAAWLAAPQAEPTQVLEAREYDRLQSDGIAQALEALDARSRRIVEARWLRDASDGGTMTLHQLADEFGVSAERIRQIEAKALQKMKGALAAYV
ncbi:MAG: RNA polymerase sigma factor RpoH [Lautropia sp.]|nr:MAG: RNA polymerase sigma factor RpoH [Pseudomonadota bacterium]MBC6960745.1 RNA polymerase sigma factor RpoH [Lautropia sp.]MCL4700658.1 RNA polymerase sigma factor RpoH [Burkholderiaceae bacterium]MDL1908603.1 RNA polymerase sigma factor RpoH [Betaproteobacteria bacterium PRO1]RIK87997.1 MAG: RNA polymerase sigma factor RpoH [Burkholderiales bacterium]